MTTLLHPSRPTPEDHPSTTGLPVDAHHLTAVELGDVARFFAADQRLPELLDLQSPQRRWEQLARIPRFAVWLISWPPGSSTGWHDHGPAAGAFTVLTGELVEHTWHDPEGLHRRTLTAGDGRTFERGHRHDVLSLGDRTAVSVHAYSPALTEMGRYHLTGAGPVPTGTDRGEQW